MKFDVAPQLRITHPVQVCQSRIPAVVVQPQLAVNHKGSQNNACGIGADRAVKPVFTVNQMKTVAIRHHVTATARQAAEHQNGVPWFQLKSVKFSEPVIAFSSNYPLYASMSNRVMVHLEALAPRVEQYSIDEMFLYVRGIDSCIDFEDFGHQLREHVRNGTGLTIGVGMGPTKTLAKSTQWASKEWPQFGGVLALTPDNIRRAEKLLSLPPVEVIWGVGRRISKKLNTIEITTALQLAHEPYIYQEELQCGSGEKGPGTQWRKLYFTGGRTAPQTADSLQPVLWRARHDI